MKNRYIILILSLFFLGIYHSSLAQIQENPGAFTYNFDNQGQLDYYVFKPAGNPLSEDGYPLILAIHGTGEMIDLSGPGSNLTRRETVKGWASNDVQNNYRPYILAPQVSLDASWQNESKQLAIDRIIHTLIDNGTVDPNRIYIIGHSIGGSATWGYPAKLSTKFAAMAPMSTGSWFDQYAGMPLEDAATEVFPDLAIWNFHHFSDPGGGVVASRGIIDEVEMNNNEILFSRNNSPQNSNPNDRYIYTEYIQASLSCSGVACHQVCDVAIKDPIFIDWLFSQNLTNTPPPPPPSTTTNVILNQDDPGKDFKPENNQERASVISVPYEDSDDVKWIKIETGNGYFRLKNKANSMYITASGSNNDIFLSSSANDDYSQWIIRNTDSNEFFLLENKGSGKNLRHDDGILKQRDRSNGSKYRFKFLETGATLSANTRASNYHDENLFLFPVPADQTLAVKGLKKGSQLFIIDTSGRHLLNITDNGNQDVSNIQSGFYLLQVVEDGRIKDMKKLVIQH